MKPENLAGNLKARILFFETSQQKPLSRHRGNTKKPKKSVKIKYLPISGLASASLYPGK
jgi:hypothetical protein